MAEELWRAFLSPSGVSSLVSVGWLVLATLVFFSGLPLVLRLAKEKNLSLKFSGFELSIQESTEAMARDVRDLQEKVQNLMDGRPADRIDSASLSERLKTTKAEKSRRILWVDDHPENNAFAIAKLDEQNLPVVWAKTTSEGLKQLRAKDFGLVITDMGRQENATAGLELIKGMKANGVEVPVIVFASQAAVLRYRDDALSLGAIDMTASAIDLYRSIDSVFSG